MFLQNHSRLAPPAPTRLRHLILSCPEWNDTQARLALVRVRPGNWWCWFRLLDSCLNTIPRHPYLPALPPLTTTAPQAQQLEEEEGDADTARVLRAKDAPSLRKPSMCGAAPSPTHASYPCAATHPRHTRTPAAIARGWKYKADVFRPKSERLEHFVPASSRRSKRQRTAPSTYAEGASEEALDAALDRDGAHGHGTHGSGPMPNYGNGMHAAGLQLHHSLAAHAAHNALLSSMQGFHDMPPLGLAATAGANAAMQQLQPYGTPFALPLWQAAAASIGLHPSSFLTQGAMGQMGQLGHHQQQLQHQQALDAAAAALFSLPANAAGGLNGLGMSQPTWRMQMPPMAGQGLGPPPQGMHSSLAGLLGVHEMGDDKE